MCDRGLLIRGRREKRWSNRNHKYSLFNEYLPDVNLNEVEEREAQTLLVLQYLSSFGPVTENDIAWWTGLGKTQVRDVIENIREQLVQAEISEIRGSFIMLRQDWDRAQNTGPLNTPTINLLPILDPYLMGYKERERYLDHENYDKIYDRTGNATSTILFDGRVIGVWDFEISDVPSVKIFLFGEAEEGVLETIRSKARKTGEFIADKEVQLRECKSMVTLTSRTAGGFMSPLRD